MKITFRGTLTKQDFLNGVKLSTRPVRTLNGAPHSGTIIDLWSLLGGIGIILLGGGICGMFSPVMGGTASPFVILSSAMSLVSAVVLLTISYQLKQAPRRTWESSTGFFTEQDGEITEDAVFVRGKTFSSEERWESFRGYGQHHDLIILTYTTGIWRAFPRHFFKNDGDWEAFKNLAAAKLPLTHAMARPATSSDIRRRWFVWLLIVVAILVILARLFSSYR